MKIHYLQHVPFEGLASIESWAIKGRHSLSVTRLYANESLPAVNEIDWLIVMGGPMNIHEDDKYPWLTHEKRFIEAAIKGDKTVIGVCLGAQLIAHVLGARVYQGPYKEIGWYPISLTDEAKHAPVFASLPPEFMVFHWHGDTFDLPPGATRLAYSDACRNQAFVYKEKVLGLQFHLETTRESAQRIIENCGDELVEGQYIQRADEILARDSDFAAINNVMVRLLNNLSGNNAT